MKYIFKYIFELHCSLLLSHACSVGYAASVSAGKSWSNALLISSLYLIFILFYFIMSAFDDENTPKKLNCSSYSSITTTYLPTAKKSI